MTKEKIKLINEIIDSNVKSFVEGFEMRYEGEVEDPMGVINLKRNNVFIAELGEEFMFYSALVRSFDSAFGRVLENIGSAIAKINFNSEKSIKGYILPQQEQHIDYLMNIYEKDSKEPQIKDYNNYDIIIPKNKTSFEVKHISDNYLYDSNTNIHYLIELKAGGDLDNKKARAEKVALLHQYFILKNSLIELGESGENIKIFFATAYNKYGEGKKWHQANVETFFCKDELLIGKNYWNLICKSDEGFNIIFEQYKKSAVSIKKSLERIKHMYF